MGASYSLVHGTLSPDKGLEGPHETHCVSSIVLEVSVDSLYVMDVYIFPYFSVFYMDLFGEGLVF